MIVKWGVLPLIMTLPSNCWLTVHHCENVVSFKVLQKYKSLKWGSVSHYIHILFGLSHAHTHMHFESMMSARVKILLTFLCLSI